MAFFPLLLSILLLLPFYYYLKARRSHPVIPIEWPLVGMLPAFVANMNSFHDFVAGVLAGAGCSFAARGTPGLKFFVTCDPANVRHIFTSNFGNYPKGEEFAAIFDVMGDSFFNADGESWRRQRAKVQLLMTNPRLLAFMARCCREKVEKSLLPFLDDMARTQAPCDVHDLFTRLTLDMTTMGVFGVDPGRLSVALPSIHVAHAMDAVMEVGFFRHTVPASIWKLMKRLEIGPERKLSEAHGVLHDFVVEMLAKRQAAKGELSEEPIGIASSYVDDPAYVEDGKKVGDFLCATLINYMFAGRDTMGTSLSWLFYNLIKNPRVVSEIRKELEPIASAKNPTSTTPRRFLIFEPEEAKTLIYLQAALFESMRLYPPGPIERKAVVASDVLPSGHEMAPGDTVLISLYAMGRMEGVWGKDCREYKPERWISEDGKLKYVPSYKFLPFNTGPRSCLGKDISLVQMKTLMAAMVWNFDMELMEDRRGVEQKLSVVLQMKHGLMVRIKKREMRGGCNNA